MWCYRVICRLQTTRCAMMIGHLHAGKTSLIAWLVVDASVAQDHNQRECKVCEGDCEGGVWCGCGQHIHLSAAGMRE